VRRWIDHDLVLAFGLAVLLIGLRLPLAG